MQSVHLRLNYDIELRQEDRFICLLVLIFSYNIFLTILRIRFWFIMVFRKYRKVDQ